MRSPPSVQRCSFLRLFPPWVAARRCSPRCNPRSPCHYRFRQAPRHRPARATRRHSKRREIADAQDVPPYIIFNDATLMAMVEAKPSNRQQMALLIGVGERKLTLYADQFLAVVENYMDKVEAPETVKESVNLYKLGYSVEKIAAARSLKEETIYNHFSQALEQGMVQLMEVMELPIQEINQIEEAILNLPNGQKNALKPVYDIFEGQYSYGVLRCVRASLQFQTG